MSGLSRETTSLVLVPAVDWRITVLRPVQFGVLQLCYLVQLHCVVDAQVENHD
jgi:hypothetical protein